MRKTAIPCKQEHEVCAFVLLLISDFISSSDASVQAPVKQGIVSSAYLSGGPLGPPGSVHLGADQTVPQHSLQGLPPQGGNVHAQPGTVMIRADGMFLHPLKSGFRLLIHVDSTILCLMSTCVGM